MCNNHNWHINKYWFASIGSVHQGKYSNDLMFAIVQWLSLLIKSTINVSMVHSKYSTYSRRWHVSFSGSWQHIECRRGDWLSYPMRMLDSWPGTLHTHRGIKKVAWDQLNWSSNQYKKWIMCGTWISEWCLLRKFSHPCSIIDKTSSSIYVKKIMSFHPSTSPPTTLQKTWSALSCHDWTYLRQSDLVVFYSLVCYVIGEDSLYSSTMVFDKDFTSAYLDFHSLSFCCFLESFSELLELSFSDSRKFDIISEPPVA